MGFWILYSYLQEPLTRVLCMYGTQLTKKHFDAHTLLVTCACDAQNHICPIVSTVMGQRKNSWIQFLIQLWDRIVVMKATLLLFIVDRKGCWMLHPSCFEILITAIASTIRETKDNLASRYLWVTARHLTSQTSTER